MSSDPAMADGLNWYRYANNNPIMYSDPTGLEGEIVDNDDPPPAVLGSYAYFQTMDEAAADFANQYNGQSILDENEYGALIYSKEIEDEDGNISTVYYYGNVVQGPGPTFDENGKYISNTVDIKNSKPEESSDKLVGGIHTHGKQQHPGGNNFSGSSKSPAWGDIGYAHAMAKRTESGNFTFYLSAPSGQLKAYDVSNNVGSHRMVNSNQVPSVLRIPSDPNSTNRSTHYSPYISGAPWTKDR